MLRPPDARSRPVAGGFGKKDDRPWQAIDEAEPNLTLVANQARAALRAALSYSLAVIVALASRAARAT
jgi:hypothetical protein